MRDLGVKNLDIYITGKCNYQCDYCYGEDDSLGTMDKIVFLKALEFGKYINANTIQFCGGEPLVCSEFKNYATKAKEAGFGIILRTNGIHAEKQIDFIAENCEWVGISIDGLPESNSLMRRSRTAMTPQQQFSIPIKAILLLKEKNPAIKILLASLASKKNYLQLPDFAEYLINNNIPIDIWKIYEFITDKFRSQKNHLDFAMSEADFDRLCINMPKDINGAPVLMQSAHSDRVSANCLIVFQNGDIKLLGKKYGNVSCDNYDNIIEELLNDNALDVISNNKEETYGNK